jgi:3-hydroxyisobutyrate dehydrogenase-like beta-hydroxyacid dehydrogenase
VNVGFIGLGSMGSRIVTLLLDGGHHVTAWARRPASLEPFGGRCDRAASPAEVGARSELVGICVWDDHDVDEVLLGADGVFAGLPPGGVVAVHSTISPASCRRLHAEADRRGLGLVDAPVSVGSHLPKLLVMVGGDGNVVDQCRDAFDSFGDPVLHLGPVGSGQVAKLLNNTLLSATIGLGDDTIALGRDLDLDEEALAAALAAGSSGGTWSGLLARRRASVDGEPGRTHEWARKDVGLTLDLVAGAGIDPERDVLRLGARGADILE